VPYLGLPVRTRKRTLKRLLRRALRHYEIAVTTGPCLRLMHSCRPDLDMGAGLNNVRSSALPKNWMAHVETLTTPPRIRGANNNCLATEYGIHLNVNTEEVGIFNCFLVSDNWSFWCTLCTKFIEQNIEAILPRLCKIVRLKHVRCTVELPRPTPIVACLIDSVWHRQWQDKPARV